MATKESSVVCEPCGVAMTDNRSYATCPKCNTSVTLTKAGNAPPQDRPSNEHCESCNTPMVIRYDRSYDRLFCVSCQKAKPITATKCIQKGCDGDLVEIRGGGGTIYRCSKFSVLAMRSGKCAKEAAAEHPCPVVFRDPPLLSGGPDGKNACPKCGSILVFVSRNGGNEIACSSNNGLTKTRKPCTFREPATGNEVYAPKLGELWDDV